MAVRTAIWSFGIFVTGVFGLVASIIQIVDSKTFDEFCSNFNIVENCGREADDNPPPPQPIASPLALSINGAGRANQKIAAEISRDLSHEIGKIRYEASGYIVRGLVTNSRINPSGTVEFQFLWKLHKGRVTKTCQPILIEYRANMPSLAAARVAQSIVPFIANSIQYEDVRC